MSLIPENTWNHISVQFLFQTAWETVQKV